MALDGPYTVEDLIAMTGGRRRSKAVLPVQISAGRSGAGAVRLLGIDPGTRCVGWGVIEQSVQRTLRLVECGCIRPAADWALERRLCVIFAELEEVIARLKPAAAALEETFAGKNMKSAIAMGEGRGIAMLALARASLPILHIAPRSIKHAISGSGAAGKAHVAAMVAAQLGLKSTPKPRDVTDALAAAIALARRGY
jgi:crossover junction endodeoxyribonuclease RuvC